MGRFVRSNLAPHVMATVHPSSLLRIEEDGERKDAIRQFVDSQHDQYDEGHSLDSRTWAPVLNRRPRRAGRLYVALAIVMALELAVFGATRHMTVPQLTVGVAFTLIVLTGGWKLSRSNEAQRPEARD